MAIDIKYHREFERKDDELFQDFKENTNIFSEAYRNSEMSIIDYSAKDIKGRFCSIELKSRLCETTKYPTTFIECSKFWKMIEKWEQKGFIPLYINFYEDGVMLFDLRKFSEVFQKPPTEITINNKGYYNQRHTTYRYELDNSKAVIFIKINGKYKIMNNG